MHDARSVGGGETARDVTCVRGRFVDVEPTESLESHREHLAFDELHREKAIAAVLASTGFEPYRPRTVELSAHDEAVAEACRPAYERLRERRVRV